MNAINKITLQNTNRDIWVKRQRMHICQISWQFPGSLQTLIVSLILKRFLYTPGTKGWSRLRDRTLAVPKNRAKIFHYLVRGAGGSRSGVQGGVATMVLAEEVSVALR